MTTRASTNGTIRAVALALAAFAALAALAAFAAGAQAAPVAKPAWKLLAITAPTNLPTKQSEVQRLTVEAGGGSFRLTRKAGTGSGTPLTQSGVLKVEKGNETATISSGSYAVGQRLTVTNGSFPADTTVVSCSTDCVTAGSTVTLSNAPTLPETGIGNAVVKIFTTKLTGVTGNFHVGDILSGTAIAPNTVVTEVGAGTLTTTKATTSEYASGPVALTITQPTAPISYDATPIEVQAALDAMPDFAPGGLTVTGGPGGDIEHPYFIAFGGPLADQDVEAVGVDFNELTGEHPVAHVLTTVPGGPGTGTVVVLPANNGGKASSGAVTVTVGPFPAGVVTAGAAHGNEWNCPGSAAGQSTVTCVATRTIHSLAVTPNPLDVPVEVEPSVPFTASAQVEVSGGGAPLAATFQLPVVVSNQPAAFGLAAIWAGSYEADGSDATQAGGHPYSAASDFMVTTVRTPTGGVVPAGDSRDVRVDLQPGFVGNPLATKRCPQSVLVEPEGGSLLCNQEMSVGFLQPYVGNIEESINFEEQGLFNNVPPTGYAAAFSTLLALPLQTILASVRSGDDYGIRLTAPNNANFNKIYGAFAAFEGVPAHGNGQAVLTNASDCAEQVREAPTLGLSADSWQEPGVFSGVPDVLLPPVVNCEDLEFETIDPETEEGQVGFSFQPTDSQGSSPVGATAHIHLATEGLLDPSKLATPDLKKAVVTLPPGLVLNPSSANGLESCSEAQIGYKGNHFDLPNPIRFNEDSPSCPDGSKLGSAEIATPLLDQPLPATIYLAAQEENPFGSLIAIYLVVDDPRTGLVLKLPGEVRPDPQTGQLTATFDYNPQLPFGDLTLHFRGGGPRSEFATPEVCGDYQTKGTWTPWSAPESGPPAQTSDGFTVGGNCASSAATRPFSPGFEAGTVTPNAGGYAPLVVKVTRRDGEQEPASLDFTLPKGLIGKLAGIPYCSDQTIVAAEHKTGKEEQSNPSCPAASQIGTVDTSAGVGAEPFHVGGHLYLAGPYKGAPVSSVVITPAIAGPFDLGNVVVRAPLYVDRESAQLTAKSDPIPTMLKGIPLKVRSVAINVDRGAFILNPTNCTPMAASASIGGSNGATATVGNRFQVGGCENLGFAPKLKVRLKGGTWRNANPALVATLKQAPGQANIGFVSVALPHSEFLEQGHIRTVCTRVQFAAEACPAAAIYGHAEATTPLLDQPLTGPVYLRSSSHRLPDLVAVLKGPPTQPIEVDLDGRIDSLHGGIRTTFETVPDAPVSEFVLRMPAGKKSLIVNSTNICRGVHKNTVRMIGQNGKQHNFLTPLKAQCGKKHKKPKKHKKKGP